MRSNILLILMILMIAIISLCVFGIIVAEKDKSAAPTPKEIQVRTVTIEGCEYIENLIHGVFPVYTHKGNCTNHK